MIRNMARPSAAIAVILAMWPVCAPAWLLSTVNPARSLMHFPFDDYHHPSLTSLSPRGMLSTMRQLEHEADRMMSTLLEVGEIGHTGNATDADAASTNNDEVTQANKQAIHELRLRPSFDMDERQDTFVITVATPGLDKKDLSIDILDGDDGAAYLVIAGQTSHASKARDAAASPASNESPDDKTSTSSSPPSLRASYSKFQRRIKLPRTVNHKSVTASYDQGLLTVIIPKNPTEQLKLRVNID